MYSNQAAYEEICDKAKKYDELKEAVENIKEEITEMSCEYTLAKSGKYIGEIEWNKTFISLNEALEIIEKYTEGLI